MAYIDSNVFIYPVVFGVGTHEKARKAKEILIKIERGEFPAYTSTLTWDEVVWVVSKVLSKGDGVDQGRKLLGFPNLEFIDVDKRIVNKAQMLLDKYKLRPRDSLHIASAISKRIERIISDDEDFDGIEEIKRTPLS